MLVPVMTSIGMRMRSSALSTPRCAAPRAPPPESTSPIRGRDDGSGEVPGAAAAATERERLTADAGRAAEAIRREAQVEAREQALKLRAEVEQELKDKRAREHFERLGLSAGVRIEVKGPATASVAHGEWRSEGSGEVLRYNRSHPVG